MLLGLLVGCWTVVASPLPLPLVKDGDLVAHGFGLGR